VALLEIIGFIVVCWIGYKLLKGFFRASATVRSQEHGREARDFAVRELDVPEPYFNNLVVSNIEAVKHTAAALRDGDQEFKSVSWPKLLALVIYGEFHKDCLQWKAGNPIPDQLFTRLGITADVIAKELDRDPRAMIHGSIRHEQSSASKDSMSNNAIEALIVWAAQKRGKDVSCPSLSYDRFCDYVETKDCGGEWFPNYAGMRTWIDIDGSCYAVCVDTIDASKEGATGVVLSVQKERVTSEAEVTQT
jgi:hypothetical protein